MNPRLQKYTHIIWDWNGTLLDDAWLCVEVMNGMLREHSLPEITVDRYRSIFDFPVRDYYLMLGFDFEKEPFEVVGMEFMIRYNQRQKECRLHPEVKEILRFFKEHGFRQCILSAREQNELRQETINLDVNSFFDHICGLDDHYAHGKTDVGIQLLKDLTIPNEKIVFIGDTRHDAEVAREIGISCILVPNGHHSPERLEGFGFPIISTLTDLTRFV
jgi:phosphoglycolate phosphatase